MACFANAPEISSGLESFSIIDCNAENVIIELGSPPEVTVNSQLSKRISI